MSLFTTFRRARLPAQPVAVTAPTAPGVLPSAGHGHRGRTALLTLLPTLLLLTVGLLTGHAVSAGAAPYPPTEPCTVWAARQGEVDETGLADVAVIGSGLGPAQAVRLVLASQRTVGWTRTGADGRFRAVISAPTGPEGQAPRITAAAPGRTCTTPDPPDGGPPGGGNGGGNGGGLGNGDGNGNGNSGTGGAPAPSASSGRTGGADDPSASPSEPAGSTPATPTPTRSATPPRADSPRIFDIPFSIGLGIAAVLLVLGTLLVLTLARRPDKG